MIFLYLLVGEFVDECIGIIGKGLPIEGLGWVIIGFVEVILAH